MLEMHPMVFLQKVLVYSSHNWVARRIQNLSSLSGHASISLRFSMNVMKATSPLDGIRRFP